MAGADLDKQPDSVSSVLKVFGILQALGEEREIGITELSQRVMMSKSTVYRFLQTMKSLGYVAQEGESEILSHPQAVRTGRARCRTSTWCAAPIFRCANFRD